MSGVYNFAPGPAALPRAVLERAREELPEFGDTHESVMEMSHRGKAFTAIAGHAEARLRALLDVPQDWHVLFLQGGATTQFAALPLNLMRGRAADYVDTGLWSQKAITEARRMGEVNVVASSAAGGYDGIPPESGWKRSDGAAYLHFTANETIGGVEFHGIPGGTPAGGDTPFASDMSSNILSRPLDVTRFGVIYAGAQKNMGIAGLTVVIVRADLLEGGAEKLLPSTIDYRAQAQAGSMLNTPPTWAWYVAGLVFDWIHEQGGLAEMERRNRRKAEKLYAAVDASGLYRNPVRAEHRSRMNVPFTLARPELDEAFLAESRAAGLLNLKGHRSVGGMRASIYNAMPEEGVEVLVDFMGEFERRKG